MTLRPVLTPTQVLLSEVTAVVVLCLCCVCVIMSQTEVPASEKIQLRKFSSPTPLNQSFSFLPPAGTTREHLGLAMALKVPIFIVISKVDLCTRSTVERTVRQLERVLKQPGCNKVPMVISSKDDAVAAVQQFVQSPRYVFYIPL